MHGGTASTTAQAEHTSARDAFGDLYAFYLIAFVVEVGLGMVSPLLPDIMREFTLSAWQIGMMVTVYGMARLVTDLLLGVLLDRIDRLRLLVLGSLLVAGGAAGSGLAQDYTLLLVARLIMGTGSALCVVTALFSVSQAASAESRGRVIGIYQGSMLAGTALGPMIGGIGAALSSWRAAFFICALMGVITMLVAMVGASRGKLGRPPASHQPERSAGTPEVAGNGRRIPWDLIAINFTTFIFYISLSGFRNSMVPVYGGNQLGIATATLGFMLGGSAVIRFLITIGSGFAADRYGRKVILFPGIMFLVAGTMGFILAGNEFQFALCLIVLSIGGFGNSLPTTMLVDVVPASRVGVAISTNRFIADTSMVVGPVMLGWILDTVGFPAVATLTAVLLLLTMPGVALTVHEKRRTNETASTARSAAH